MAKKIMIVDDAMLMRNMLKNILKKFDCSVCAETGSVEEVISLYKSSAPDIVFMDLILDDEEQPAGLTLIDNILSINKQAVIIVVSALNQQKISEKAIEIGAAAYISKPFSEQKIKEVLLTL